MPVTALAEPSSSVELVPDRVELTILMPCLNEARTVASCVETAIAYLERSGVSGEVVVADNGSTDGSQELARAAGARVIDVPERGYGAALQAGLEGSRGDFVVMADADMSYDFSKLDGFVEKLRSGYDLVLGNRFRGGIEKGAMPWHHRYLGNPVLSFVGRQLFRAPVRDFHCGLRGVKRTSALSLALTTSGMEYASEMIVKAVLAGQRLTEVPTSLRPDGRDRTPHLRSFRDGWRHLRFLFLLSPNWLYIYPGLLAALGGIVLTALLVAGPVTVGSVTFDTGTMVYTAAAAIVGYQALLFGVMAKAYAHGVGMVPPGPALARLLKPSTLEIGALLGLVFLLLGVGAGALSFVRWAEEGFANLDSARHLRVVLPAALGLVLGFQTVLASAFLGFMSVSRPIDPASRG
jgi:hypothetical protein